LNSGVFHETVFPHQKPKAAGVNPKSLFPPGWQSFLSNFSFLPDLSRYCFLHIEDCLLITDYRLLLPAYRLPSEASAQEGFLITDHYSLLTGSSKNCHTIKFLVYVVQLRGNGIFVFNNRVEVLGLSCLDRPTSRCPVCGTQVGALLK